MFVSPVRLTPIEDIDVTPLLPPKASPEYVYRPGGVSGREQSVAAMFIDLRGSTGMGEQRLPYDVVFILNQFFSEMSIALEATDGHYAQFSGDGLMALYGLDADLRTGCKDAIRGAIEMAKRMNDLNSRLSGELAAPLRIGIGIHCGEAIVGTMGPPKSPNFSAIGDNINIAARLEAKTKDFRLHAHCFRGGGGRLGRRSIGSCDSGSGHSGSRTSCHRLRHR